MNDVVASKVRQAVDLLAEFDIPVWIVQFARETYDNPQPVQGLCVGSTVSWPSAFIIAASGESIAIVGTGDVAAVKKSGAYQTVIGYVKDVAPPFRETLQRFSPVRIGVSYSVSDDSADNLTHGMYMVLTNCLAGTPYADRLISAERVLGALRARKQPMEIDRIRAALASTDEIVDVIHRALHPEVTERNIGELVHAEIAKRGLTTAWAQAHDPIVNFGPGSDFGHAGPGEVALDRGMLVHVDLGVKRDGYCSDLQRMWYLLRDREDSAPSDVTRAFDTVVEAMRAGFRELRPGVTGRQVDAVARKVLTDAGYAEPEFALGHQLGRTTHDGGALLGPPWPRYGTRPETLIEEGNVFTLEYSLMTSAGQVGVEEDVVVTRDGAEYLSNPQTELRLLRV